MRAPTFREILDVLRAQGGRRGAIYVFSDADRDRISDAAAAEAGESRTREAVDRALDLIERELAPFRVEPI